MKNLLIILLLLFFHRVKAQNIDKQYDTCQYFAQYEGEWLYANNLDTVRIFFRKNRQYSINHNHYSDLLYGWHEYKQGNTIIESDYANRFIYLPFYIDSMISNRPSISLLNYDCTLANSNKLEGLITDFNQANEFHSVKTFMWGGG